MRAQASPYNSFKENGKYMSKMKERRKILIVGGTSGIGLSYAQLSVAKGDEVTVAGHNVRNSKVYREVHNSLKGAVTILPLDLSNEQSTQKCLQQISQENPYDVFCYTAGIFHKPPLTETSEEDWRRVFEINVHGFFRFAKVILKKMMMKRKGNIIVLASISAVRSPGNAVSYVASKGALVALIRSIAKDYGPYGIRANAISPGLTQTPMTEESIRLYGETVKNKCPLRRLGQPEDIANLIDYLTSDKAEWITGQNYIIDGGLTA